MTNDGADLDDKIWCHGSEFLYHTKSNLLSEINLKDTTQHPDFQIEISEVKNTPALITTHDIKIFSDYSKWLRSTWNCLRSINPI